MRQYLLRVLKSGIPTALALAAMGYLFAQMAVVFHFDPSKTNSQAATDLTNQLESSVPLTMAIWGFGLIALCELFRSLWRVQPATPSGTRFEPTPSTPTQNITEVDAEKLLMQLLDQADAAERVRAST